MENNNNKNRTNGNAAGAAKEVVLNKYDIRVIEAGQQSCMVCKEVLKELTFKKGVYRINKEVYLGLGLRSHITGKTVANQKAKERMTETNVCYLPPVTGQGLAFAAAARNQQRFHQHAAQSAHAARRTSERSI